VLPAAGFVKLVGAAADSLFQGCRIGNFAGWFGTLVIDLGFADGFITCCEPLHVALQLIRFGTFLCHVHSVTRTDELSAWLFTEMRRLRRFLPPHQEKDQETDDNHQNAADEDESRWHTVRYLAVMLHQTSEGHELAKK
jgi:hypothetical protein